MTHVETERLEQLLLKRHGDWLKEGERIAVTHQADEEMETLTLDVVNDPAIFRFQAGIHVEDTDPEASAELLIEFLDAVLEEWLKGHREAYPTLDYSPYTFRGVTLGLRGGPQRPDLEDQADALLRSGNPDIQ
jgi:hypothetical protein